jgi:hypothetical protein
MERLLFIEFDTSAAAHRRGVVATESQSVSPSSVRELAFDEFDEIEHGAEEAGAGFLP